MLLPKFKLEKDYNLVEALRALGVTALFDKNSNTTGITDQRIVIDLVTPTLACPVWAGSPRALEPPPCLQTPGLLTELPGEPQVAAVHTAKVTLFTPHTA